EGKRRQSRATKGRQQEEESPKRGEKRESEQALLGGLPLCVLSQHLGVVAERKIHLAKAILHLGRDGSQIASAHVGPNIEAALQVFVRDDVRRRRDAHVGYVLQVHVSAAGDIDRQLAKV